MSQGNKSGTACGDGESCEIDFGDDPETDGVTFIAPTDPRFLRSTKRQELMHLQEESAPSDDRVD